MSASARSPHCASHRFVAAKAVVAFFRAAPAIEFERFVTDLDSVVSQDRPLVPEQPRHQRGLVDTSANIDLEKLDPTQLPTEVAVDTLTTAELAAGPHARANPEERGRRQDRLQRAEAAFDPLPFDSDAARAYGRIFSAVMISGRSTVKRLARRPGIVERISPHGLRHSFITCALDAGVALRDVQESASHSDPRTTMRYDRGRGSLDRPATYIVATFLAGASR